MSGVVFLLYGLALLIGLAFSFYSDGTKYLFNLGNGPSEGLLSKGSDNWFFKTYYSNIRA